jgi:ATP diphosphatase
VWEKVEEELGELKKEIRARKSDKKRVREELGDLVFCLANLARHLGFSAEEAGREAAAKFAKRFQRMENESANSTKALSAQTPKEWERAWLKAKNGEKTKRMKKTFSLKKYP